jgi:hypothetical protein
METVGDIYAFIKENIINPNESFYLTTSPPLVKYQDMKATIYNTKLAPSTLMYINFPNIPDPSKIDFLKEELQSKYITNLHN